jgi:hypothetical protein
MVFGLDMMRKQGNGIREGKVIKRSKEKVREKGMR